MVKNPPANAGDAAVTGSIPGSGRSPGRGNQYSLSVKSHGQRSLMEPQSRTLLGTHPPGKHCYHDFIQAQRRESYTPLPENESGAQSGFRLPFLVPERGNRSPWSQSSSSLSRPLVAIVARAWLGAFTSQVLPESRNPVRLPEEVTLPVSQARKLSPGTSLQRSPQTELGAERGPARAAPVPL